MTPGAERAPAARWHRLLALSQRWYMRFIALITAAIAGFLCLLHPSGLLVVTADAAFLLAYYYVVGGQFILFLRGVRFQPQPFDPRWGKWVRPAIQVWFLAVIVPMAFICLLFPVALIYPALLGTPVKTALVVASFIVGSAMALLLLLVLVAVTIVLPIGIFRATARARRRRRYDYPPHVLRR